jgi:hypothetical protein
MGLSNALFGFIICKKEDAACTPKKGYVSENSAKKGLSCVSDNMKDVLPHFIGLHTTVPISIPLPTAPAARPMHCWKSTLFIAATWLAILDAVRLS